MNKWQSQHRARSKALTTAIAVIMAGGITSIGGNTFAQDAEDDEKGLEEIVVTGTRIKRSDFITANPVTTYDRDEIENLGIVDIGELFETIPSNLSNFQPETTGGGAFFVGSTIANLRGMNPFFGTRTLTMVDSRRLTPTTQGDSVDLRMIPSVMIDRAEVVTGGASAAYGSGAVAGVVNVIMDRNIRNIRMDADYGVTSRGDADNWHIGLATGGSYAKGRGTYSIGGEYQDRSVLQSCADARYWCGEEAQQLIGNTYFDSAFVTRLIDPSKPAQYLINGMHRNQISHTGVIYDWRRLAATGQTAWQFNEAGTDVVPYQIGFNPNFNPSPGARDRRGTGDVIIGGDGELNNKDLTMYPASERTSVYGTTDFAFTDNLTGRLSLSYSTNEAYNRQWGSGSNSTNLCIQSDNGFLSSLSQNAITQLYNMRSNTGSRTGAASVLGPSANIQTNTNCTWITTTAPSGSNPGVWRTTLRKDWSDQLDRYVITDTETLNVTLSLNGKIFDDWQWDLGYRFGKTLRDQNLYNQPTYWRLAFATDVVTGSNGQPICRVNTPNFNWARYEDPYFGVPTSQISATSRQRKNTREPDHRLAEGCVPLNPFGTNPNWAEQEAALKYAFANITEHNNIRQDNVDFSISGPVWKGVGAGPLMAAGGLEYRSDRLDNNAGGLAEYIRSDFQAQFGDSFNGSTSVYEWFAEAELPLLVDKPFVKYLMINAAVRQTHYDNQGSMRDEPEQDGYQKTLTWKFAGVYNPFDWLRFRGSLSQDQRAAGFRELFYSQTRSPGTATTLNPWVCAAPLAAGGFNVPQPRDDTFLGFFASFSCSDSDEIINYIQGNPDLDPEVSKTFTGGIVLSPTSGWLRGMNFSADFYQINLTGGQALFGTAEALYKCYFDSDCQYITFTASSDRYPLIANSDIESIRTTYINREPQLQRGVDFAWSHMLNLEQLFDFRGFLNLRVNATWIIDTIVNTGGFGALGITNAQHMEGVIGGGFFLPNFTAGPKWTGNLTVGYSTGPLNITSQVRYIERSKMSYGVLDPSDDGYNASATSNSAEINHTPDYFLVNLNGSYNLKLPKMDRANLFLSINNLFDKRPPFSSSGFGGVGGVNAQYFDTMGRTYRFGIRTQF